VYADRCLSTQSAHFITTSSKGMIWKGRGKREDSYPTWDEHPVHRFSTRRNDAWHTERNERENTKRLGNDSREIWEGGG
jgi:hypothetical protein